MRFFKVSALILLCVVLGHSQELNLGPKGVLFQMGGIVPFETYNPSFGILVGTFLGRISNVVEPTVEITYWKVKYDYYKRKDNPNDDIKRRLIGGNVSVLLHLPLNMEQLDPYVGGGLALNLYKKDYPEGWPEKDKSSTNLEPHLDFGIISALTDNLGAEFRAKLTLSEIDNILLLIGVRFGFGK